VCRDCLNRVRNWFNQDFLRNILCDEEGNWSARGIVDTNNQIFPMTLDTKVVSKIFESQLVGPLIDLLEGDAILIEADYQNQYPDFSIHIPNDDDTLIAVDVKSTYRLGNGSVNGMTLGAYSKTSYFRNRDGKKNIKFPYNTYCAHLVLGIVYSRGEVNEEPIIIQNIDEVIGIPTPVKNLKFFIQPKWAIASKKAGSGNTTNIGSVKKEKELFDGQGTFANEKEFDEYWMNY
jgi:hypothetical protein